MISIFLGTYRSQVSGGGSSDPLIPTSQSVSTFALLPPAAAHSGKIYWVRTSTGVWPVNRRNSGAYESNGVSWVKANDSEYYMTDETHIIIDNIDPTIRTKFDISSNTPGQTRVHQLQDKDGILAHLSDITGGGESQAIEFSNVSLMSFNEGSMARASTKSETANPTGMPSTSSGNPGFNNGNNDGWTIRATKDFTKIGFVIAGAAVAGPLVIGNPTVRFDIYETIYGSRTLLRTERIELNPSGVGIFGNASGDAFQYVSATIPALNIAEGKLIGMEFVDENGISQIVSARRINGFMI